MPIGEEFFFHAKSSKKEILRSRRIVCVLCIALSHPTKSHCNLYYDNKCIANEQQVFQKRTVFLLFKNYPTSRGYSSSLLFTA